MQTLVDDDLNRVDFDNDGHLVHTNKRPGERRASLRRWPDLASAKKELAAGGFSKIEWEDEGEWDLEEE
jgi:hypothetical protein